MEVRKLRALGWAPVHCDGCLLAEGGQRGDTARTWLRREAAGDTSLPTLRSWISGLQNCCGSCPFKKLNQTSVAIFDDNRCVSLHVPANSTALQLSNMPAGRPALGVSPTSGHIGSWLREAAANLLNPFPLDVVHSTLRFLQSTLTSKAAAADDLKTLP